MTRRELRRENDELRAALELRSYRSIDEGPRELKSICVHL
jgi:hypothetical protein